MTLPALLLTTALAPNLPTPVATPFPLGDVRLLTGPAGGPWERAHRVEASYLLRVEPDRLLHSFRTNAGLKPKGEIYGGWESSGLAGHTLGHYLSACAQEFAATGDVRFRARVDHIVTELAACQAARSDGYLGAIPDGDVKWAQIRRGDIRSNGFDLNGMWSPWYTVHKIFAGLLDAQTLARNPQALTVARRFADWAIDLTKDLTDEQWQRMLACEYGGMNESLAELAVRTGETKYLDLARRFYDRRVLDPLAAGRDELAGKHSNTQIPKIIGLARLYETTGDAGDRRTAEFFWRAIVDHRTYAIGGNSNGEYLGPPNRLAGTLSTNTCETCNTYNMLRLTRHLFAWAPSAARMDFYERASINHILGSIDAEPSETSGASSGNVGGVTYFVPLASGAARRYSSPWDDFTCCHGTGMENHTKYGDTAYSHSGADTLWVNLFLPTELNWREAGVRLRQETRFPDDGVVRLSVLPGSRSRVFEMRLRHPGWARGPVSYRVNGREVARSRAAGSYASIRRTWRPGDRLEFRLPMSLRTEAMPDDRDRVSVLYGPMVLAADLGPERGPEPRTPVLVGAEDDPATWLERVPGASLAFRTKGVGRPADLTFRPFAAMGRDRYATYFDRFTEARWQTAEAAYRAEEARQRDLEARTIDAIVIGQMQPERDHSLKAERNDVREANGRAFRTPLSGGWFEFTVRTEGDLPLALVLSTWGNELIRPDFSILVDGVTIATERESVRPKNVFSDVTYPIPAERTRGKAKVTIRIQAREGKGGPSVTGARIVRTDAAAKGSGGRVD